MAFALDKNTSDNSIISGTGLSSDLELSISYLYINKEPNAASTGYAVKSREKFWEELLAKGDHKQLDNIVDSSSLTISPPKTFEERLQAAKVRYPKKSDKDMRRSGSDSSVINVNDLSYLSASSFLAPSHTRKNGNSSTVDCKSERLPSLFILETNYSGKNPSKLQSGFDPWKTVAINATEVSLGKASTRDLEEERDVNFSVDEISSSSTHLERPTFIINTSSKSEEEHNNSQSISMSGELCANSILENQHSLLPLVGEEKFNTFNLSCLEEENFKAEGIFDRDIVIEGYLSGSHNLKDLATSKPSWIGDTLSDFKMGNDTFERLLQVKSCKLGSLENDEAEKPSFGFGLIESPPKEIAFESHSSSPPSEELQHTPLDGKCSQRGRGVGNEMVLEDQVPSHSKAANSQDLETTLSNFRNEFKQLFVDASKTEDPAEMIRKVIKLARCGLDADESSFDASNCDIQELRALSDTMHHSMGGRLIQKPFARGNPESNAGNHVLCRKTAGSKDPTVDQPTKRPVRFRMGTTLLQSQQTPKISNEDANRDKGKHPMTSIPPVAAPKILLTKPSDIALTSGFDFGIPSELHFSSPNITGIKSEYFIHINNLSKNILKVSAADLKVEVVCNGLNAIDFGIVPETCLVSREVTIINRTNHAYLVILSIQQPKASGDVFYWSPKNTHLKLLTPTSASVELPDAGEALKVSVMFRAPSVDSVEDCTKMFDVSSKLSIFLDNPFSSAGAIEEVPIQAKVAEVCIRTLTNEIPLIMKVESRDIASCEFSFINNSMLPLSLKFGTSNPEWFFVSSVTMIVGINAKAKILVSFNPLKSPDLKEIDGFLKVTVEPKGLEFDVPLKAIVDIAQVAVCHPLTVAANSELSNTKWKRNRKLTMVTNKSHLVFGAVGVGQVSSQEFKFYNCWTDEELALALSFEGIGSDAFTMSEDGDHHKFVAKEIVIPPSGVIKLLIHFEPSNMHSYFACLVSKPLGIIKHYRVEFPIQGYGGSGELSFALKDDKISFNNLWSGKTVIADVTVKNIGSRPIFVKLRVISDDPSFHPVLASHIKAFPDEFVVKPEEKVVVLLTALGTPSLISNALGQIGSLQAIYGNEILRSRYKKCRPNSLKLKKVNDLSLLNISWGSHFSNESIENDDLPLQPEDIIVFLNECRKINIPLYAYVDLDSEANSTRCIAIPDDTLSLSCQQLDDVKMVTESVDLRPQLRREDFEVFPKIIKFSGVSKEIIVSVINYSTRDQEIEILGENCRCVVDVLLEVSGMDLANRNLGNSQISRMDKRVPEDVPNQGLKMTAIHPETMTNDREPHKESRVMLAVDHLDFPTAKIGTKTALKLSLKNLDTITHQISVSLSSDNFLVRHTTFSIKGGYHIFLPVFFTPSKPGTFKAYLHLTVNTDGKCLSVFLGGQAVS